MTEHLNGICRRMLFVFGLLVLGITACTQPPAATTAAPPTVSASGEGGWLAGTVDQKFDTVAKQLRGFDMAMVETGYRYTELHWAVQDRNWGYADYQIKSRRSARRWRAVSSVDPNVRTRPRHSSRS